MQESPRDVQNAGHAAEKTATSLFVLYLELFRVVSQGEERSGRPIIIEKHNDPVNSKAAEKSTTNEFQSAVVNKETDDTC